MWFWLGRFWFQTLTAWNLRLVCLLNFIRLSNFVSSVEEINKIMLCLVDLVLFALLSEIFFDRTLLWPFFGPESFGFQSSSKSTLWRSFCNDYRNKVKLLVQALTSSLWSVYPKCHFVFFINWNVKLEIKFWFSFLYWSWDRKHQNKWFSDFETTEHWNSDLKFGFRFSF